MRGETAVKRGREGAVASRAGLSWFSYEVLEIMTNVLGAGRCRSCIADAIQLDQQGYSRNANILLGWKGPVIGKDLPRSNLIQPLLHLTRQSLPTPYPI